MNARPQKYANRQSRLTNFAAITGVAKLAKLLHQGSKGHKREETSRSPRAPAPSPITFPTNTVDTGSGSAIGFLHLDPEEYQHARKELKKAVLELYR